MLETSLSLLDRLRTTPDEAAWRRLDDLYRPWLRRWLLGRDPTLQEEADDLVQEVLSVLVRELPQFRNDRPGSFRRWLVKITVHRLQAFWRSRRHRRLAQGQQPPEDLLAQVEDPNSALSQLWDREHDQYVMQRLLVLIEPEFAPGTWQAFRRVVLDDGKPAQVAADLGMSVNAVLLAKSRVLKRLRQEGQGLLD
jgi:RNA polymerase sigma-70 factor (ECF subfamily)